MNVATDLVFVFLGTIGTFLLVAIFQTLLDVKNLLKDIRRNTRDKGN